MTDFFYLICIGMTLLALAPEQCLEVKNLLEFLAEPELCEGCLIVEL